MHWYGCLRTLGIRTRGLYCAKDPSVSLALTAGVNVDWLEGQVGVSYLVLRKHYGRYMMSEGPDQLAKMKSPTREDSLGEERGASASVTA